MTRPVWKWTAAGVVVLGLAAAIVTRGIGFTSRASPSALEGWAMRAARRWATPSAIRDELNPVAATPDTLQEGLAHWADHCALCHDNDGSGRTAVVRGLYPPAPDMRAAPTQAMTDGDLFYVIERGIPLTGMPAWGNGTPEGQRQSWALVRFIRHLPVITESEIAHMETLNPRSTAQIEQERTIEDFLRGKGGD